MITTRTTGCQGSYLVPEITLKMYRGKFGRTGDVATTMSDYQESVLQKTMSEKITIRDPDQEGRGHELNIVVPIVIKNEHLVANLTLF